jgi:hypothetical protein
VDYHNQNALTKNHTPPIAKPPKNKYPKHKHQTMKFIQMITAALAGTVADWDNWGKSLSSSLFFQNTKNTKIMFPSRQWEIDEILTAPPSIFVPGYTVLDSPAPLLFIIHVVVDYDVASFDLTTINSPFKDLLLSSFALAESLRRVVPTAGEFLEMKIQLQEGIAARVKNWNAVKTVAAQNVRRWTIEFVQNKNTTTILPRYVWDLMTVSETIWQWRFLLQALTLAVRWSAASTTPWMALVLIPKILLATLRAFDVPHKVFAAAFPQLATTYRLLQMITDSTRPIGSCARAGTPLATFDVFSGRSVL